MTSRPTRKSRSLAELKRLLKDRPLPGGPSHDDRPQPVQTAGPAPEVADAALFAAAMVGVTPLSSDKYWRMPQRRRKRRRPSRDEDPELDALQRLIDSGDGFRVADTPEYMESDGPGIDRNLVRRLHQGRYAVQGYVDLHGLTRAEAEEVLARFIHNALTVGKRMVLVIHGRGLTSTGQPILKNMVYTWLTRGPQRRFVLAFTSARSCDGGAGATYVLLRQRPWSKKMKATFSG